ncbi:hypothetical protein R4K92_03260 [Brachyspira intermedia]|uniref:hypothetical protein n=1 Tax=Brachyspira intermedia TaxID=84377 RepID=UPI003005673C
MSKTNKNDDKDISILEDQLAKKTEYNKQLEEENKKLKEENRKFKDKEDEIKNISQDLELKLENYNNDKSLLDKREALIKEKEKELLQKENDLINEKIASFNEQEKSILSRIESLNKKISELEREKTSKIKEIQDEIEKLRKDNKEDMDNIFSKEKQKIENMNKELEDKRVEIDKKEKDAFNNFRNAEKEAIDNERKQFAEEENKLKSIIDGLRKDIVLLRQEKDDKRKEIESAIKNILDDLDKRRAELDKKEKDISKREVDLEEQIKKSELAESKFNDKKDKYDNLINGIDEKIEQETQDKLVKYTADKDNRINELEKSLEILSNENKKLNEELERYENAERISGGKSKEELNNIISTLKDNINELKNRLANSPDENEYHSIREKAINYDKLYDKYIEKEQEFLKLKEKFDKYEFNSKYYGVQISQVQNELDLKTLECEGVKSVLDRYKSELDKIKKTYENVEDKETRVKNIKSSIQFTERLIQRNENEDKIQEIDWLDNIYDKCKKSGIEFNKRLLYAFHTSLKSSEMSPLTILSGVSGTGKSELPRLYSRFGGLYFISLPVQPDWDSPQSLFGYFNSLDNKYNSTSLLRAMIQFALNNDEPDKNKNLKDSVLLVLLDEMNLAHIELYFSDLLSKFESRRGNNNIEYIDVDLGTGYTYPIAIGDNILWTGTMNEDETTKSLSDKVIDRGYQINFSVPEELVSRDKFELSTREKELKFTTWKNWITSNKIVENNDSFTKYKEIIQNINKLLDGTGRAMGHRIWQSIEIYMRRHPINYYYSSNKDRSLYDKALELSFEEALVYKVMPKLRGMELGSEITLKALNGIRDIINTDVKGLSEDYKTAMNTPDEQFIWRSAKYLESEEVQELYKKMNNKETNNN